MIPAGAGRIEMDIMHMEDRNEGGASTGRMYLPGYDPEDRGEGEVYVRQDRPGGPWVASDLPGGMPAQSARDPHALMAKVAALYGITGVGKVEDERDNARTSYSGTRPLNPAGGTVQRAERTDRKAQLRAMSDADLKVAYRNAGALEAKEYRAEIERRENLVKPEVPATTTPEPSTVPASAGTGPGTVAVGATDADRATARPRIEGETDRAYAVRTAPSREAALRMLNGHQLAGLRAIARDEGVVPSGTKADLLARLMRVMYDRHADAAAITRMVNRAT